MPPSTGTKLAPILVPDQPNKKIKGKNVIEVYSYSDLPNLPLSVLEAKLTGVRYFKRHNNLDGSVGGFVEVSDQLTKATVDRRSFIGPKALVIESATVLNSRIYGHAWVIGANVINSNVYDFAMVLGGAKVKDSQLWQYAQVSGMAEISNGVKLYGNAEIAGMTKISGDIYCNFGRLYHGEIDSQKKLMELLRKKSKIPDYQKVSINNNYSIRKARF